MSDAFAPTPTILQGKQVRLEPLDLRHGPDLFRAGQEVSIWSYMPRGVFQSLTDTREWIVESRQEMAAGTSVVFAIVLQTSGQAVGSTRYLDIRPADRALEIGWTWLSVDQQRTAVNTECKYLLLGHAFQVLQAWRVQLKTDARNVRSQRAIERIGAQHEGILRRQKLLWDGFVRDTVYYSILDTEWPAVRRNLQQKLAKESD